MCVERGSGLYGCLLHLQGMSQHVQVEDIVGIGYNHPPLSPNGVWLTSMSLSTTRCLCCIHCVCAVLCDDVLCCAVPCWAVLCLR